MRNHFPLFNLLLAFATLSACSAVELKVPANSEAIHYMGRIEHSDTASVFFWSGTSAEINFEGTSVKAILQDERGENYYNAIVDGDSVIMIRTTAGKESITLVDKLPEGKHSIQLFKRTEFDRGKTWFYGFELNPGARLLPSSPKSERSIEFYGNSITCGYAVEDTSGKDRPDSIYTNNYLSYAAITARHYEAEYHCISKSGIGITISWFPYIMPDIYNRLDPQDASSTWDFSRFSPDVLVIHLLQNDSWLVNMPEHESFKHFFGTEKPSEEFIISAYRNFVSQLRTHYPAAQIICTMGGMDATREGSPWPGYVETAVKQLNDPKIFTYFMPYKNTGGHPSKAEQEVMAEGLIQYIDENIQW
ncbi:SGNH/GDSL hydrolase family protein [Roseimarinus sediminis]|uniref:SGNH/GDSL hydrolase family protein n=1 Tax=Roseimarinus sediminis TaxID=1610899 RepID=UPI003D25A9BF